MSGCSVLAALTLAIGSPLPAQEVASPGFDTYWIGGGLGAGSRDFAGHFNVAYQTGANLLSLRAATTAGIFDDGFGDVALLYGRATRAPERYQGSVALGLAVADGCPSSGLGGCHNRPSVIGLPLETQVFWRPSRVFGLGLYGFADINHSQSFVGVTLGIQLGRLRWLPSYGVPWRMVPPSPTTKTSVTELPQTSFPPLSETFVQVVPS
jgi:hypothetical protein